MSIDDLKRGADGLAAAALNATTTVIDLTWALAPEMSVAPEGPPLRLTREWARENGDPVTAEVLSTGLHVGTHVDAPFHFIEGGATIDELHPLALSGSAVVLDIADPETEWLEITGALLDAAEDRAGERVVPGDVVLLRTRYSERWAQLPAGPRVVSGPWPYVGSTGIEWLLERRIRALGVETPDPERRDPESDEAHRRLLGAGVPIVEGLAHLSLIPVARCLFVAIPLPFSGASGSPVRALALVPDP